LPEVLQPALLAGKYRVVRRLGEGGVADVYEGVQEEIGQRVAIKILKRDLMEIPGLSERFLVEARVAGAVGHPGIVQVFDYGHLPSGEPYLVMELLVEEDLYKVLRRAKRFEIQHAIGVLLHVLDALGAAHRAGVVHRDMKPENVIITRGPGGEPWAKVIDFGIARIISVGAALPRQTAVGTLIGTPHYLSPEQARGEQDIDARTDIYSVGVMLFELLTGKTPFEGGTAVEVAERVLTDAFPSPRSLNASISVELEQVILKATAHRREDRYATAREFMDALRPFKGESVTVRVLADDDPDELEENSALRRISDLAAVTPTSLRTGQPVDPTALPGVCREASQPGVAPSIPPPLPRSTPAVQVSRSYASLPPPCPRGSTPPSAGVSVVPSRPPQPLGPEVGARATGSLDGLATLSSADLPRQARRLPKRSIIAVVVLVGGMLIAMATVRSSEQAIASVRPFDASARSPDGGSLAVGDEPPAVALPAAYVAGAAGVAGVPETADWDASPSPRDADLSAEASLALAAAATDEAAEQDGPDAPLSAPWPQALVKLEGLPFGAQAEVDGQVVGEVFAMEVSDESHTLRVAARGWKVFVREFRVHGELTIPVQLEPNEHPVSPGGRDSGIVRPEALDAGPRQPLGNPFGGV
jgi:serine/threonine protein kinase